MVKEVVEKGVLTTLAAWLLIHEKADEMIKDMIERGKKAPEGSKKFLEELSWKVDEEKEGLKKRLGENVEKTLRESGCATGRDIEEIKLRLEELEGRISVLENTKKKSK